VRFEEEGPVKSARSRNLLAPVMALFVAFSLLLGLGIAAPASVAAVSIDCSGIATPGAATTPAIAAASSSGTPDAAAAGPVEFPSGGGSLTVFAAASLTDAFTQIGKDLEAANPGLKVTFNFAGSQALVSQMTEGAAADVFASAGKTQMDAAVKAGLIDGKPANFTQNRLAIVVPKDNPAGIATMADLAKRGVKLVLAAPAVPVGGYAVQSICTAGEDTTTYGADFAAKVAANIVSQEDNVKAVLAKVQTGEADAGITYTTDVSPDVAKDVTLISIPAAVNAIAKYPIAAVHGGNADLAAVFIAYIDSDAGQATLKTYGFEARP
jgi:molybdate transport system substrate-binding protein